MKVELHLRKSNRHPGTVYASILSSAEGTLLVNATAEYCFDCIKDRGFEVVNCADVMAWIIENGSVKVRKQ